MAEVDLQAVPLLTLPLPTFQMTSRMQSLSFTSSSLPTTSDVGAITKTPLIPQTTKHPNTP